MSGLLPRTPNSGCCGGGALNNGSASNCNCPGLLTCGSLSVSAGASIGGVLNGSVAAFSGQVGAPVLLAGNGSPTAAGFAFASEPSLGMYRPAGGTIGFGAEGKLALEVGLDDVIVSGGLQVVEAGSSAPSVVIGPAVSNGLSMGPVDGVSVCAGGSRVLSAGSASVDAKVPILEDDGSYLAPSFSFSSEPGLGVYRDSAGVVGISSSLTTPFISADSASIDSVDCVGLLASTSIRSKGSLQCNAFQVLDFSSTSTTVVTVPGDQQAVVAPTTFGFSFTPTDDVKITAVQIVDQKMPVGNRSARFYRVSDQAIVFDGSIVFPSPVVDGYITTAISPVVLDAGVEYIFALTLAPNGFSGDYTFNDTCTTDPAFTPVWGVSGPPLAFPTIIGLEKQSFGVSFQFAALSESANIMPSGDGAMNSLACTAFIAAGELHLSAQPFMSRAGNASQTIATSTETTVTIFGTAVSDVGGVVYAAGVFTPPGGTYMVTYSVFWADSTVGTRNSSILINNITAARYGRITRAAVSNATGVCETGSCILELNGVQNVRLSVFQDSGGNVSIQNSSSNRFMIYRLC